MKLPLFYKDPNGKWQIIPLHAFEYKNHRWELSYESYSALTEEEREPLYNLDFQAIDSDTWYIKGVK